LCFYQIFSEIRRFQAFSFYLKIEWRPSYLDLPLQGLDVVDDLVQHHRLPSDLNQTKSIPRRTKRVKNYEIHISESNEKACAVCAAALSVRRLTLLQPGTRSCRSFILSLIFSLLNYTKETLDEPILKLITIFNLKV
jgi:hypothetical protein